MMTEVNAVLTLSYRDLLKFLRDVPRILSSLIFPIIIVAFLGEGFRSSLGAEIGFDFLTFVFTGVLAQTLFQSTAIGIVSLIEDRENDFSQEIFVAPISRYSIVFGKIFGETLVSLAQGLAIVAFGFVLGVPLSAGQLLGLIPTSLIACLFGGAFGILLLSNLNSQRAANQIFPFIMLPQYFLAGVFNPIQGLPWFLTFLSIISPMRYAVDLMRGFYYLGGEDYNAVVLFEPLTNLAIIAAVFLIFLVIGTWLFVRRERNR